MTQQCALVAKKAGGVSACIKKAMGGVHGSPPPLLCVGKATSGGLCPVLSSSVQPRQGTSREGGL